ncbi:2342_t:CDS:2 [Acaulospora morrowiae]|uniref:2342_t:CDS:1 n=1 Tax=Acaulospora morrowiae TaxID=94023 RepID=A0A9N9ADU3_9GLOM|nr:2342_t:CDS:2 [Acaulospora morrowiae]
MLQQIHNLNLTSQCRLITDSFISDITNFCPKLEHLDIGGCDVSDIVICNIVRSCTNVGKDALSKLNPKIKIKRDSTLDMEPEELDELRTSLVYLVGDLWLTYANLGDIVQYCEDKIKDNYYQKSIVELKRDMRNMAERLGLMISIYGLQPTNPELNTKFAITEFVPRDIKSLVIFRSNSIRIDLKRLINPEMNLFASTRFCSLSSSESESEVLDEPESDCSLGIILLVSLI